MFAGDSLEFQMDNGEYQKDNNDDGDVDIEFEN